MIDMSMVVFVDIVGRYYPGEELNFGNGGIIATGYLGRLIADLLSKGYARKFKFITYLIEHVEYQEAIDKTEEFIEELMCSGILFRDAIERDLYRVSALGFDILARIRVCA